MRQAGRYMPVYRKLRERYGILELIKTPDLAAEVTLQPIDAFDLDAAIIFADILPPLQSMGLELSFVDGDGPMIHNPVRSEDDVDRLRTPPAGEALAFTLDAIRLVRQQVNGRVPLIGFSGAPFTLACYAIEGGASRNYAIAKQLMHSNPTLWHALMNKLTHVVTDYLLAQIDAGVEVVQLFDSWIGALSPGDYSSFVMPYSRTIVSAIHAAYPSVPVIHFGTGTSGFLPLFRTSGADVIGVDWRIDLLDAWSVLGSDVSIQGNLDPLVLRAPIPEIERQVTQLFERVGHRDGHIFNLGHGIHKDTPEAHVAALIDIVHRLGRRKNPAAPVAGVDTT